MKMVKQIVYVQSQTEFSCDDLLDEFSQTKGSMVEQ